VAIRTISILGSTGSVGTQTLDLILAESHRYHVRALVGGRNVGRLAEQAKRCRPEIAVINDPSALGALRAALAGTGITAAAGASAVREAAAMPADWTMASIMGMAGLHPTLAAIRRGGAIAFANKEVLVSAGDLMMNAVTEAGARLLPVDSEHNAIFQCLETRNRSAVERIILTASGGPFRQTSREAMATITPEAALRHPVWSMGAKISIDSATMMNKGLELIEAARLFDLDETRIDVLFHPQSIIHGMVYYHDGSVLAQLGSPDMRIPIAHTLAWPRRMATKSPRLDLAAAGRLEFESPDLIRFPALRLAREVLQIGGGTPTILNAANEIAVEAFLQKRIGFLDISRTVERVLQMLGTPKADTLDDVIALNSLARRTAHELLPAHAI
jgi:1-deoxy-D-xylulose-5-phosphate reductoisomerase